VAAALAQTWNTDLMEDVGRAVCAEMTEFGVTWWLAPAMNIVRNPLSGRNYEYYSEDPLLSGKLAAAVVRGVQKTPGNYVTIKHFAVNSQEEKRYYVSSDLDERALRQIYVKGFEIAVRESAPRAVMSAYNKINGVYCANNRELCTDILRSEWGFDGIVMTDWLSTGEDRADEAECLKAGVDLIMPGGKKVIKALLKAYREGRLPDAALLRSCGRVLNEITGS
jgi:beta-glucosidase